MVGSRRWRRAAWAFGKDVMDCPPLHRAAAQRCKDIGRRFALFALPRVQSPKILAGVRCLEGELCFQPRHAQCAALKVIWSQRSAINSDARSPCR